MHRALIARRLVLTLLFVELLDELAGGALGAALPHIRTDLGLTYIQVGALFAIPAVLGNLIEIPFGVLADRGHRRRLVLTGGIVFAGALAVMAGAQTYLVLLAAVVVHYPASGAFVSISQAVLVDTDPSRGEALMARWTLAGSIGVVVGPLLYAVVLAVGGTWRMALLVVVLCFVAGVAAAARVPIAETVTPESGTSPGWRAVAGALRRREVIGALVLLDVADLLEDVLGTFLALYLVDVAGVEDGAAALALAVWAGAGLIGDALAVPVLDRLAGRLVVRVSAGVAVVLYAAMLVVEPAPAKVVLLALLGLCTAGWYPVLLARYYATMPGQSGVAVSVSSVAGIASAVVPLTLGVVAEQAGLRPTMWLLLVGPVVLVLALRPTGSARPCRRPSGPADP
jgi:FSR family fosmidomycin resistance protein-like MFS transporter